MNHWVIRRLALIAAIAALWTFIGARFSDAQTAAPRSPVQHTASTALFNHQFVWEAWGSGNGLQQNSVLSIAQSKDGYLWIGTQEGLARFDGVKFTVYNNNNSSWVDQDTWVRSLLATRDGSIWVGTTSGLNRFVNGSFTSYTTKSGLPHYHIQALCEDAEGAVWIGTPQGLARFQNNRFTTLTIGPDQAPLEIKQILASRSGGLWIGTADALYRYRDNSFTSYPSERDLGGHQITCLYEDRRGTLWIGTAEGGVFLFREGAFTNRTKQDGFSSDQIKSIAEDEDGRLWIGTTEGLDYFENERIVNFNKEERSFAQVIETIYSDSDGNLWLGNSIQGLIRIRKSKFSVIGRKEGLSDDVVASVMQARDGSIWVATDNGLNRLSGGVIKTWTRREGLPDNAILSLLETRDGSVWVGTANGLCRYQESRFKCYTEKDGLPNSRVMVMAEDRDGGIWFGAYRGIFHFNKNGFDTLWNQGNLMRSNVNGLTVSKRDGSIWLSTTQNGLFRIHENRLTNYTTFDGLPTNQLNNVTEDRQGNLWLGTERGLVRYRDGRFITYDTHHGLPFHQVFAIIEDDFESIWISSNNGINRVLKSQFDEIDQGKLNRLTVFRYGHGDGMRSVECNASTQPIAWKMMDGHILIPTMNGMVVINPRTIVQSPSQPKVSIEQVLVDQKPVPAGESLEIGPDVRNLEIQYTALSYFAPQQIRFKYLLEGYDPEWVDAGFRRSAFYTGVPPGTYRFRIIAANAEGKWDEIGAGLRLRLRPAYYQTWWFYTLTVSAFGILIFLAHKARVTRSNETLLKKIAMSLPTAMAVTDQHNSVKMLNEQFIKYFGFTGDEIRTLEDWFHFAYPVERQRNIARADWLEAVSRSSKTEGSAPEAVWQVTRKDGSVRDVEFRFAQIRDMLIVTFNDVTERKRAEERLRELAARLQTIREEERAFISREMHDELGQLLTGLKLEVKWLENKLPFDSVILRQKTGVILELINDTIKAVRTIATEFRPSVLDNIGLMDAIEWLTVDFQSRMNIRCEVIEKTDTAGLDPDRSTAIFRILQESLTNVARHANATLVMVSLRHEDGNLVLQVEDDGRGIRDSELAGRGSLGLLGMRERAHQFHGDVSIDGVPGEGTTVTVTIPLKREAPMMAAAVH
ncbi:MAG: two-component regulator propeller domain-containing protein [Blastocatellia bacterium]|nr:two-component regulator propeller domain-containing protein [Blastocatellia bacterium]